MSTSTQENAVSQGETPLPASHREHPSTVPLFIAFALLVALLILTFALSFAPLGMIGTWTGLAIGALQMLIVGLVFMRLRETNSVGPRLAAGTGIVWLAFYIAIVSSDYMMRGQSETAASSLKEGIQYARFDKVDYEESTQAPHRARPEGAGQQESVPQSRMDSK